MAKAKLSPEVAEKFELVNWKGGSRQNFGRFGVVDLETLTVKHAARLVALGFKKLKAKPAPKPAEKPAEKEKSKGK